VFLKRNAAVALCVWLAFVQGCRHEARPSLDLTLAHEVSPQPARTGPVTITLAMTDASGKQVSGAKIKLEANMSHPGMIPIFADAMEISPGRYQSNVELSMAGDWYVLVHATLPDGRKWEREFDIKGVSPAGQ
jgi:hypothetical protein